MKAFLVILALCTPLAGMADDGFTSFISATCGQFVSSEHMQKVAYEFSIMGFVTGANYARARDTDPESASYLVWVREYCKKNPFNPLVGAAIELDKFLGEGKRTLSAHTKVKR